MEVKAALNGVSEGQAIKSLLSTKMGKLIIVMDQDGKKSSKVRFTVDQNWSELTCGWQERQMETGPSK